MGKQLKDLTGKKFGLLTVLRRAPENYCGGATWECLCQCGKMKTIRGSTLRSGATKSCGCGAANKAGRHTETSSEIQEDWKFVNS